MIRVLIAGASMVVMAVPGASRLPAFRSVTCHRRPYPLWTASAIRCKNTFERRDKLARVRAFSDSASCNGEHLNDAPLPPAKMPRSALLVRDSDTGCDIYLVGCLHGSPASGRDVQHVMDGTRPGAVVLELCESRHRSLRKDVEKWARGDAPAEGTKRWKTVFKSWWKGVKITGRKSGLLQAVLAGFLSSPYLLQRLSNFDPGLEFKTAMLYADASLLAASRGQDRSFIDQGRSNERCEIVLGDQDVQETLRRLGGTLASGSESMSDSRGDESLGVPATPGGNNMFDGGRGEIGIGRFEGMRSRKMLFEALPNWTIVSDARVLRLALYGPRGRRWPESLNVFGTIWAERETLQDLAGLLAPMALILYIIAEGFQRSLGSAAAAAVLVSNAVGVDSDPTPGLEAILATLGDVGDGVFLMASVWYTLRFFRLVIKERDDVLAESIVKACREHPGRPVVAVLGLLHCNGVAEAIRRKSPAATAIVETTQAEMEQ